MAVTFMPEKFVIPTTNPGPYVYGADSQRHPDAPQGTVTEHQWRSAVFPGTERTYWVYLFPYGTTQIAA